MTLRKNKRCNAFRAIRQVRLKRPTNTAIPSTKSSLLCFKLFYTFVKMKILAVLLNLYMALLMLMPCQDRVDSPSGTEISFSTHQESSAKDDCGQELCPPFCSCACCSVGKHLPIVHVQENTEGSPSVLYTDVMTSAITKQPFAIWQPPKLV